MFSVRGPKLKYFVFVMALIAIAGGVYMTFFESKGYVKTEATIVSIEEDPEASTSDDTNYIVMVDYIANGSRYTSRINMYSGAWKVGKTITVYYDPHDPAVVHGGKGFGIYLMVLGAVLIAGIFIVDKKNRAALAEMEEVRAKRGGITLPPSVKGEEREVYFLTDMGTPKYGHRIEDKDRKVLYEAKMTKFSMVSAYHFDFIDHEHGTTTTTPSSWTARRSGKPSSATASALRPSARRDRCGRGSASPATARRSRSWKPPATTSTRRTRRSTR